MIKGGQVGGNNWLELSNYYDVNGWSSSFKLTVTNNNNLLTPGHGSAYE